MELQMEDSVLVKQYVDGDEKALEVLINRHNQKISSFIYSKVLDKDITEDIFQDTFIKVIKTLKKGSYSEEGKFLPWVMRIAHNLIIDHFR
jgi:RNA polymerase sigma factor (sigma-70 family)